MFTQLLYKATVMCKIKYFTLMLCNSNNTYQLFFKTIAFANRRWLMLIPDKTRNITEHTFTRASIRCSSSVVGIASMSLYFRSLLFNVTSTASFCSAYLQQGLYWCVSKKC